MSAELVDLQQRERENEAKFKAMEMEVSRSGSSHSYDEFKSLEPAEMARKAEAFEKTLQKVVPTTDLSKLERRIKLLKDLIPLAEERNAIELAKKHSTSTPRAFNTQPAYGEADHNAPRALANIGGGGGEGGGGRGGGASRERAHKNSTYNTGTVPVQQQQEQQQRRQSVYQPQQQTVQPKPSRGRNVVERLQQARSREGAQKNPPSQGYPGLGVMEPSRATGSGSRSRQQLAPAPAADAALVARPHSAQGSKSMLIKGKTRTAATTTAAAPAGVPLAPTGPVPRAAPRTAPKKSDPVIELLESDDDDAAEADGGGLADPHTVAGRPSASVRPTRATVSKSIPQRIGQISAIYPPLPNGVVNGAAAEMSAGAGAGAGAGADADAAAEGAFGSRGGGEGKGEGNSGAAGTSAGGGEGGKTLDTVEVTSRDLLTLVDGEFLNDSVIDFFIKKLRRENMKPEDATRCHIFNSFFFQKLVNVDKEAEMGDAGDMRQRTAHERVRKWTRGVDIFKKDFVFFPIHSQLHWSVVVLCHPGAIGKTEDVNDEFVSITRKPGPYLLHLDSMAGGHKTGFVIGRLREYLAMEWLRLNPAADKGEHATEKNGTQLLHFDKLSLPHARMKIPQQDNGCDCGVFLLLFMERFITPSMPAQLSAAEIESARRDDTPPEGSSLPSGFLRNSWFVTEEAALKRSLISMLILEQLRDALPDPEKARRAGTAEATVKKYEMQHKSIKLVMEEVYDRISERTGYVSAAEDKLERRRAKDAAAQLQKRLDTERRAAERGETREEKAVADQADDGADAAMFYGTAGKGAAMVEGKTDSKSERGAEGNRVTVDASRDEDSEKEEAEEEEVIKLTSEKDLEKVVGKVDEPVMGDETMMMAEEESEEEYEYDDDDEVRECTPFIAPPLRTAAMSMQMAQKAEQAKMVERVGRDEDAAGNKRKRDGPMGYSPLTMRPVRGNTQKYDEMIEKAVGKAAEGTSVIGTTAITGNPDKADPSHIDSVKKLGGWENILSG